MWFNKRPSLRSLLLTINANLEKIMTQLDDANAALATLQADVDTLTTELTTQISAVATEVSGLQAQITALQGQIGQTVDLTTLISTVNSIDQKVKSLQTTVQSSTPATP